MSSQSGLTERNDGVAGVLIIGASRGTGLEVLRCARKAAHKVGALARSADAIAVSHPDLAKVAGDALDRGAVTPARADVAHVPVKQIDNDALPGETPVLTN